MPTPIQSPGAAKQLVDALGLKGRFGLRVDEITVGVLELANLEHSPYQDAVPVGRQLGDTAAGVGRHSMVGVQPAPGVQLYVEQVVLVNQTGGAMDATIAFLDAADVATLANLNPVQLFSFNRRRTSVPEAGSTIFSADGAVPGVGDQFHSWRIAADVTSLVRFPRGVSLNGDDPSGVPALVVINQAANAAVRAVFMGTEYRPKG